MDKYKAIIFDMDGVLVDTEQFYYNRRQDFMNSQGISIDHLKPSFFIGGNMKGIWPKILGEDYGKWDIEKLQKDYVKHKKNYPLPYKELLFDNVDKVLSTLKKAGYKLALASSSTNHDIDLMLEENNLRKHFSIILSGEDFKETKPNPEIYITAINQLGVDSQDVLIIEDSEKGIEAGVNAGADVWAIEDTRFGMNQSKADLQVSGLSEVVSRLV
ncbi:HAD family hydrolase [Floricoccus penangensis]|uniref:HAD family hydrolase n=1 Tax=Floricoccus penangensis TaxID=1859475 RepID=A0A9Q5JGP3_9LACT|nr:HAD family phosphatase [Floricoccus penangensis]OFI46636.1 HAD family hydrolase [Floricoccus penangensis]